MDEVQHISAAQRGDLFCSGGTSQHGDRVCLDGVFKKSHPVLSFLIAFVVMISSPYTGKKWIDG